MRLSLRDQTKHSTLLRLGTQSVKKKKSAKIMKIQFKLKYIENANRETYEKKIFNF